MRNSKAGNYSLLMLFQAVFVLPIAISASVESSVIKMKPVALVPVNNAVRLNHAITS